MRIPVRATYRVQLTPDFDLDAATAIVPYLARLGISHLYASPVAQATAGSTHGYDVTDPQRVRDELGGEPALRRLWEALDDAGMGMVVDIVPNHMGIRDPSNRWWQGVLREGRRSDHAGHFDIEWSPPDPASAGKVVLPFLGSTLEEAVRDGALRVERGVDPLDLVVVHHGDRWPASPESLALLDLGPGDCTERIDGVLEGLHRSPAAMTGFLDAQHWRAVHWRDAGRLLNWRRFFDVTDLAAVRVERPDVFDDVHQLLRDWFADELGARVVQGVRVDHVDGLVDPQGYLERLRALVGPDRLLVVEKILAADEDLPPTWPVDGTTGYEVMARLDEAATDPVGAPELARLSHRATGQTSSWPELELECKRLVADRLLAPEVDRLARAVARALGQDDGAAPPTDQVRQVVAELAAGLGVYRTYARPGTAGLAPQDRAALDRAAGELRRRGDLPAGLLDDVVALLTRERGEGPAAEEAATRFGQVTAPLAAKAVEDTGFYREVSLPWLAEVGGDPARAAVPLDEVADALAGLQEAWPGTFVPLTSHDTKRSGDVRARLAQLAHDPVGTEALLAALHEAAAAHRSPDGPDPGLERLLWQSVLGAWPIDAGRLGAFATKAMREAKAHTTWTDPDPTFEDAVQRFVEGTLADPDVTDRVDVAVARLLAPGRASSLTMVTLSATALGSPDLYQGDEVWNLSLVDPDNRRPVDHDHLADLLGQVGAGIDLTRLWQDSAADPDDDGLVKLALWHRLLGLRADRPASFAAPNAPLPLDPAAASEVLAFDRDGDVAVVAWVRPSPSPHVPPGTVELPTGAWHDVVSGRDHEGGPTRVADLLHALPVAVLARV